PVLVVELGDGVRAYPLQLLMWHELAHDTVGGVPILVSYCPLCNSAIVFDRRIDGEVHSFGVSGMLRESDMVMYDRETDSLWQQISGEAIVGTWTGKVLKRVRSQTISFASFSKAFPDGLVLSRNTGHNRAYGQNPYVGYEFANRTIFPVKSTRHRRPPLERIATVSIGQTTKAYPFPVLDKKRVMEDKIGDSRYVVFFEKGTVTPLDNRVIAKSRDVGAVGVFKPEIDGKHLRFRSKNGRITDKDTGSTWNVLGFATDGPMAGTRLEPVDHGVYFAFAWLIFNPKTKVVGASVEAEIVAAGP
ncbi:MAG: DUF3179 domain-containing protein, partial [bacterium]|nr:DUF3179 domain-containing protein [bacterium]